MTNPSPISKAERLLDLVIALLNAPYYRTAQWIRRNVAGYGVDGSDDSFARKFERDKQELRDLGIPIETQPDGDGYRILPGDFSLPDMTFTPAEQAALAVASRLWENSTLREVGAAALRKVQDATVTSGDATHDISSSLLPPIHARVTTTEPGFDALFAAIRARRAVEFDYLAAGSSDVKSRRFQPWGLISSRGVWYVVGYDEGRKDRRTFRLSRMSGPVRLVGRSGEVDIPADLNLSDAVHADRDDAAVDVELRIRQGTATGLRRRAQSVTPGEDGWDVVMVSHQSLTDVARTIAGYGDDVIVIQPPEVRRVVIELLQGAANAMVMSS